MMTGEPPYPEGTVLQKLLQHQGDDAPDPAQKNRQVPENLSIVVRKMMAKDPRRRYQSSELLVRDLMLVAGALGLRSVGPEGLVWLAAQPDHASFWERHLAWMVTAALLLLIVGYMEFGERLFPSSSTTAAQSDLPVAPVDGTGPSMQSQGTRPGEAPVRTDRSGDSGGFADSHSPPRGADSARVPSPGGDTESSDEEEPVKIARRPATGATADAHVDDEEIDPDDARGEVEPFPLKSAGRHDEGLTIGPRLDVSEYRPAAPWSITELLLGSSRLGFSHLPHSARDQTTDKTPDDAPPHTAQVERISEGDTAPAVVVEDEAFVILGRENAPSRSFKTLEAACSSIRENGAVIELRFNGRRRETAVRINRKVTIRAARGYRPLIEFRPSGVSSDTYQARAVWMPSGALELVGVDLVLAVDETVSADQWALFALERADSLRLQGVTITLLNPSQRTAAVIDLRPGAMMPEMPVAGAQPKPPLDIEISDSLVRGDGDLFLVRHAEPARLAVKQSVVALQGTLLSARGHTESAHENAQLELRLEHVTSVLGAGLIRLDSGNSPRKLLPVQVSASNSIISNTGGGPLVSMTGNSPPQDFRALLFWIGQNNFYDRFQTMWSIASTEGTGRTENWDAAAWRRNLSEAAESSPRFEAVVWNRRQWLSKPLAELVPGDFALDRQAPNNPAVDGATNFSDAGANLTAIPKPNSTAGEDRARD
jgi:serine/threonine-protein kinase